MTDPQDYNPYAGYIPPVYATPPPPAPPVAWEPPEIVELEAASIPGECCFCHFWMQSDDIAIPFARGGGVCVRCYNERVDDARRSTKKYVRELEAVLNGMSSWLPS